MYTKVEWNSTLALGYPSVDKQHLALFRLVDDIPDYLDVEKIKKSIMKLYDYTGVHFSEEEKLMQKIGYPDLINHQKIHYDLVSKLSNFSRHSFSDLVALDEFKEFTNNWLVEHIMHEDMKYKRYVEENNISW